MHVFLGKMLVNVSQDTFNTFDKKSAKNNVELAEDFIQESKKFLPDEIEVI